MLAPKRMLAMFSGWCSSIARVSMGNLSRLISKRRVANPMLTALAFVVGISGCATHESLQYFAVRDEDTGATNYYRLKISGHGSDKYKFQAGYFSAASVDVLRGQMPEIPELDLPVEQILVLDRLLEEYYGFVLEQAKGLAARSDRELADLVARSMGQYADTRTALVQADVDDLSRRKSDAESNLTRLTQALDVAVKSRADAGKTTSDARAALLDAEGKAQALADKAAATSDGLALAETEKKRIAADGAQIQDQMAKLQKEIEDSTKELVTAEKQLSDSKAANDPPGVVADHQRVVDALRAAHTARKSDVDSMNDQLSKNATEQTTNANRMSDLERDRKINASQSKAAASKVERARLTVDRAENAESQQRTVESLARTAVEAAREPVREFERRIGRRTIELTRFAAAAAAAAARSKSLSEQLSRDGGTSTSIHVLGAEDFETRVKRLARFAWYGSLSASDVVSVGMTENSNPYQFRKLVFWATLKNLDLQQFASEIDATIDNVVGIGGAIKSQAKDRAASKASATHARKRQFDAARRMIGMIPGLQSAGPLLDLLKALDGGAAPPDSFESLMEIE